MAYPIRVALESGLFAEVMVSTDDDEIAQIARAHGAVVPFMRSMVSSSDHASTEDVLQEVIIGYRSMGHEFDHICCLYPTAALVKPAHLMEGYSKLVEDPALGGVLPVIPFGYPVQRAVVLRNSRAVMMHPQYYDSRSQDLEPAFHDAGQWYWCRRETFEVTRELIGPNCAAVVLSEMEAQDIDHQDDWRLAELKFELRRGHV